MKKAEFVEDSAFFGEGRDLMPPLKSSFTCRPRPFQRLLVAATAVLFLSQLAFCLTFYHVRSGVEVVLKRPLNVLLLGVDQPNLDRQGQEERPRTDTMLFLALRPELEQAALFSIPRDSIIDIPGYGMDRINMAHVYGGYELTKSLVEMIMEMPVDRYVMVNFECFREIVDLVDGVEVNVDRRMIYEDRSAGLKIDLQPGRQTLKGEEALGYVRFRQDALGDITRTRRQQQFMLALVSKLKKKETLWRVAQNWPTLMRISENYLQTDLQPTEILGLMLLLKDLNPQADLTMLTLPGEFFGPYWRLHSREIEYITEPFRFRQ
ncbi:MAG: LCP family protein [Firmicutes bacterium]|nr:LCP family protein [Bacillota bacterium]